MINKIDLIKKDADNGNTIAEYNFGKCLYYGLGIKKDKKLGLAYLKKASDKNFLKATFEIGLIEFSKRDNKEKGYEKILLTADAGLIEAQEEIGNIFNFGNGRGTWDLAVKYYKMASEQGSAAADLNLGIIYYRTRWTENVNSEMDEEGKIIVTLKYCTEEDVETYLRKSAEAGYAQAQYILGIELLYGNEIIKENQEEGLKWLFISAENGSVLAQKILGKLYYEGNIVEMDLEKSYYYLKQASKNGDIEAKKLLKELF
jgi:TPR repeat protein